MLKRLAPVMMLALVMSGVAFAGTLELKLLNVEWTALKIGEVPATQPAAPKVVITKPTSLVTPAATSIQAQSITLGADNEKMILFKDDNKEEGASMHFVLSPTTKVDGVVRVRLTMVLPSGEGAGDMHLYARHGEDLMAEITVNVSTGQVCIIPAEVPGKAVKKIKVGKLSKNKATVFEWFFDSTAFTQTLEVQGLDRVIAPTKKFQFNHLEIASGEEQLGKFAIGKLEMGVTPPDASATPAKK